MGKERPGMMGPEIRMKKDEVWFLPIIPRFHYSGFFNPTFHHSIIPIFRLL
jgi:hypothetical protein